MSNQSVPYYRVPTRAQAESLAAIRLAAHRSPSLRVLLNHIAYLEEELDKPPETREQRRELIGAAR